jgi:Cu/Ag efflux protein CusF
VSPQVQAQSTEPASKNQSIESAKEIRGTIVKVDAERGRLSIRHPGIESLGMPAMVMAFKVGDRVDTQGLGINDAVSFKASRVDGAYTLISIKPLDQLEPSASRPSPGIKFE